MEETNQENKVQVHKSKFSPKTKIFALLVVLLALPLTLILLNQVQNLQKEASEGNVLAGTTKPNIVIIMLDDVNPMDGRLFSPKTTPNMYKYIISKGINFTNYYVETTLCCPARVGNMTGQHTQNHGVNDLNGVKFNPQVTIATELKNVNYRTMLIGKYINNYLEVPASKRIPPGWITFDAIYANNGKYFDYNLIHKDQSLTYYGSAQSDYSTNVLGKISVDRLKASPLTKPVYLEYNPYAVHGPRTVEDKYKNDPRCQDIKPWDSPAVNEEDVSDKPAFMRALSLSKTPYSLVTDCELILSVDDWVGKIGAELSRQGRLDNTIFVLSADNGYGFKEHRIPAKTMAHVTHVPLYIAWPAGRGTSPRVDTTLLSNIDLPVTWCALAGCTMGPFPNGQTKADGISFASLLRDEPYPWYRDAILESQPIKPDNASPSTRPAWWAIRTSDQNPLGKWHYIEYATGEKELYDLSGGYCYEWKVGDPGDPCELNNLLSPNSKVAAPTNISEIRTQLAARLAQLKKEKGVTPIPITLTPAPTTSISATPTPTPASGSAGLVQTTKSITAKADSFIRSDQTGTNLGSSKTIAAKASNPNNISYIKFTLPTLTDKTVDKAILRLRVNNSPDSSVAGANKIEIKTTPNSWTEKTITYSNKPSLGSTLGTKSGAISAGETFDIDITSGLVGKTGGDISFGIESTGTNINNLVLNSREATSGKPTLIITYH